MLIVIKTVYLFTNRNIIAFDEKGEQIIDVQSVINWRVDWTNPTKERRVLRRIIKDNPEVYLAKWRQWAERITIDEFCSLLGHGEWYWENFKKAGLEKEK
jgi:hypothetical protein